jgi:hypothetical protein
MIYTGIEDDIAYRNDKLYFFPIPDYALKADSSLMLNWIDKDRNIYNFVAYDRQRHDMVVLGTSTIRNMILNHVGNSISNVGNKETIKTLRGNYITWDHTDNTIRGTRPCTIGYNSNIVTTCSPFPLDEPADNGKVWTVSYWFNF